jgi:prophage regulatory protein
MAEQVPPQLQPGDRFLRRPEVERITGLSTSTIYHRIQHDPDWPKPIPLGPNTVAWIESEVLAWASRQVERARRRRA